ncbi:MAG: viroplasmin family protein [Saprospiraceae bacterium]
MAKKSKFYVVWNGREKGIFSSWEACKRQVDGFEAAKYKSFESEALAKAAFQGGAPNFFKGVTKKSETTGKTISRSKIIKTSICVDAACSGNPGIMEYRGVNMATGEQIFHQGPFPDATNNVGEFLALVHGLAYLKKNDLPTMPIYSDSRNAILWIKAKQCRTKLERTKRNGPVFEMIERGEQWLKSNHFQNPILKWETKDWGEIPADFGRK